MEENTDTRGGIRIHRHVCRHPESMLYPPFRLFFWGSSGTGYDALSGRGIKASRTAAPGCLLFRASVWRGKSLYRKFHIHSTVHIFLFDRSAARCVTPAARFFGVPRKFRAAPRNGRCLFHDVVHVAPVFAHVYVHPDFLSSGVLSQEQRQEIPKRLAVVGVL